MSERLALVRRVRHLLADHARDFAEIVRLTAGRPPAETLTAEVLPLADACCFLEREAARLLRPRRLGRGGRPLWLHGMQAEVRRESLGIGLVIGPSNYPLFIPGVQTVQALAAGNAVLLKPGTGGGAIARRFADLLYAAGLDERLLHVLPEEPEAARLAIEMGVDKVFLTGSAQTGVDVLTQLAGSLTPAVVELSGCDAAFVRPDADLDLAAAARCPYALGATVFGAEPGASALARRIRAGVVVVNDVIVPTADPRLLFGGFAGVGGVYDWWRPLRAYWRGERFRTEHGVEGVLPAPGGTS